MLRFEIDIDDVNYPQLMELLLPLVGDKMEGAGMLGKLVNSGMAQKAAGAMAARMSEQDIAALINKNSSKIAEAAEDAAESKGVGLIVRSFHVTAR